MTTMSKLEQNAAATKRWRTRLKRAMTMLDKLEKQRRRLVAKADLAIAPVGATKPKPSITEAYHQAIAAPAEIDTAIPSFLQRGKPDAAGEAIAKEIADRAKAKTAGRIAKMKAKKSGETTRMPLTGRAALAAIRGA
jgi:hypothetical protein